MLATLRDLIALLTPYERKRGLTVLALMIAMAAFEVAGIASIMPFLSVMGDASVIRENEVLSAIYDRLGFTSTDDFLVALAGLGIVVLSTSSLVRVAAQYGMIRFAHMRRHSLARRLLYGHLRRPYEFFLNRNASELSKTILSEVDHLTNQVMVPAINLVAYGIVTVAVVMLLVVLDPILAASMAGGLGGFYALTFLLLRSRLERGGRARVAANSQRFKAAAEALAGIQELKVLGREEAFFAAFDPASDAYSRQLSVSEVIAKLPKRLIEVLGFVAVLGAAIYLIRTREDLGGVLPVLGGYAIAGYRLLPSMQELYQGVTKLRFGRPAVAAVREDLSQVEDLADIHSTPIEPLTPQRALHIEQIIYHYPDASTPVIDGLDLDVPACGSVAIVGRTGSGKSTLVKIILGLLQPSSGRIVVDDTPLAGEAIRAWQQAIGYVPQDLFLIDDSILRNIALGIDDREIDRERIEIAARRARVHDDIVRDLPEGYATRVGDRGIRLSGGQRQRLAIARALYRQPSVLVLDEATSALDAHTEAAIMNDLVGDPGLTIIAVTHRQDMARLCDAVAHLDAAREPEGVHDEEIAES